MYNLFLINNRQQSLDLFNNRSKWVVSAIEALHGIETNIAESESPYMDGSNIDNVKALPRGIELTLTLRGNIKESIEYFTKYVKSKQIVTLREVGKRDLVIKGVATIPPYTTMLRTCKLTLTIYCGQPYWEDLEYIVEVISNKIDMLTFPLEGQYFIETGRPFGTFDTDLTKTFINDGDTSVGMLFTLIALGTVVNPRINCSSGEQNGWYMQLNLTLDADDELEISTHKGNKYIKINGEETYNGEPILNYLEFSGYDWLQLETGENTFNITTSNDETSTNVYFNIIYKGRYE